MEYTIPLHDTAEFFYSYSSSLITPIDVKFEDNCFGNAYINSLATHIPDSKYEQVNINDVAFDQHHLLLDQWRDLFNMLSKHKKYLMAPLESILIRITLTLNLGLSRYIIALTLLLTYTSKLWKKRLTTWSNLVSLNCVGPLNGCLLPSLILKRWASSTYYRLTLL